jgi:hypothetical protein
MSMMWRSRTDRALASPSVLIFLAVLDEELVALRLVEDAGADGGGGIAVGLKPFTSKKSVDRSIQVHRISESLYRQSGDGRRRSSKAGGSPGHRCSQSLLRAVRVAQTHPHGYALV